MISCHQITFPIDSQVPKSGSRMAESCAQYPLVSSVFGASSGSGCGCERSLSFLGLLQAASGNCSPQPTLLAGHVLNDARVIPYIPNHLLSILSWGRFGKCTVTAFLSGSKFTKFSKYFFLIRTIGPNYSTTLRVLRVRTLGRLFIQKGGNVCQR